MAVSSVGATTSGAESSTADIVGGTDGTLISPLLLLQLADELSSSGVSLPLQFCCCCCCSSCCGCNCLTSSLESNDEDEDDDEEDDDGRASSSSAAAAAANRFDASRLGSRDSSGSTIGTCVDDVLMHFSTTLSLSLLEFCGSCGTELQLGSLSTSSAVDVAVLTGDDDDDAVTSEASLLVDVEAGDSCESRPTELLVEYSAVESTSGTSSASALVLEEEDDEADDDDADEDDVELTKVIPSSDCC